MEMVPWRPEYPRRRLPGWSIWILVWFFFCLSTTHSCTLHRWTASALLPLWRQLPTRRRSNHERFGRGQSDHGTSLKRRHSNTTTYRHIIIIILIIFISHQIIIISIYYYYLILFGGGGGRGRGSGGESPCLVVELCFEAHHSRGRRWRGIDRRIPLWSEASNTKYSMEHTLIQDRGKAEVEAARSWMVKMYNEGRERVKGRGRDGGRGVGGHRAVAT